MEKVYVVTYDGPEWSDIKGIFREKAFAEEWVCRKNASLDPKDVYDSLSRYNWAEYPVFGNKKLKIARKKPVVPANEVHLVVCAACRYPDGTVLAGVRHFDDIMGNQLRMWKTLDPEGFSTRGKAEQGFYDNRRQFLTREEALKVAIAAGQRDGKVKHGPDDRLFSEDLW